MSTASVQGTVVHTLHGIAHFPLEPKTISNPFKVVGSFSVMTIVFPSHWRKDPPPEAGVLNDGSTEVGLGNRFSWADGLYLAYDVELPLSRIGNHKLRGFEGRE
ncbi:uncharacterized protein CIMG_11096 [Coccidioides immitis RS]|uniref:Uncharacterized protein n=1 Tax=Coccidioides immitis (strain RS) TaxID=246410 RepID=A0A0D8JVY1_COCIM|nr:uncharacterized protein CIMG_11096 [Coccidioides immitis RS]KJF61485.1 hypothetical protein CIMG_11096 [Coccidioides immitis RS]